MIERAQAELGPVTILVNNAGIAKQATLDSYDADAFARMREVNVNGIVNTVRAVMGGMRQRHYGRIVNITSIAGIGTALPGNAFYAATKAGAAMLTHRFALELGRDGITVNGVAPGFVRTDMTQGGRGAGDWEAVEKNIGERAMTGRIGEPEDIANAVAFLAAPEFGLDHLPGPGRRRRPHGLYRARLILPSYGRATTHRACGPARISLEENR